jgi:hypothetical protein
VKQILFILFLLLTNCLYSQSSNYGIGVLGGTVLFSHSKSVPSVVGHNVGFLVNYTTAVSQKIDMCGGLQIRLQKIDNYKNSIEYISNWTNGYKTTNVSLQTQIKQALIEIPIELKLKTGKRFQVGVGSTFSLSLISSISQRVIGNYTIPEYADQDSMLNQSIQSNLTFNDYDANAILPKVNICPTLSVGFDLKRLRITGQIVADVMKIPNEFRLFASYNEYRILLLITYKITNHETSN